MSDYMGPSFLGITDLMSPNFGVSSSGPNSMAAPLHPLHSKLVYSAEGKGSTAAAGPFYLWRKNCGGAAGVNPSHWLLAEFLTSHSRAVLCEPWAHREWRSNYFSPYGYARQAFQARTPWSFRHGLQIRYRSPATPYAFWRPQILCL